MAADMQQLLTERFTDAIKESLKPCPLVGPKWFRYHASAAPPYFEFTGIAKLAKATGFKPRSIVERIVKNLDLGDLDAEIHVSPRGTITVKLTGGPGDPSR